ncbi:hypothetical protein [Lyngbya sp. CCAP 1446/10]|uniref:hypothetical protein n=1 Tax=Lyngbya sp. CCAP 1446/10 TaxID=439293 RepID=UPI0035C8DCC0
MNRLSYPQKFTLIGFLFAIPLTLVMYLLISEINSRVDFAQKEIYGNQYLRSLRQLREYIPKLQQLNYQGLNPNFSKPDPSGNLEAKIDANFQSLAKIDRQLGKILFSTQKFNATYQDWQNFKLRRSQWSLETYDFVYHKLAANINKLSAHVGDTSNLILDPDLDTYYLMDATLLKIPEMQKLLSEIRLISRKNSLRSDATSEERAKLITLADKLRELNKDLAINMEVGFHNNPHGNLRPKLSEHLRKFNSVVEQLTGQIDKLIYPTAVVEYYAYLDGSDRVIASSFQLWDENLNELDFLLQKRIDNFVAKKQIILIFVSIILAMVIYLFVSFYRSVMQTVFVLDEASKKMANGNVGYKIILDNRDELGQVVSSFNKIADALVGANQEISVLNDRLKAENVRMSAELDVTRKIQQMLLPKDRELNEVVGLILRDSWSLLMK